MFGGMSAAAGSGLKRNRPVQKLVSHSHAGSCHFGSWLPERLAARKDPWSGSEALPGYTRLAHELELSWAVLRDVDVCDLGNA